MRITVIIIWLVLLFLGLFTEYMSGVDLLSRSDEVGRAWFTWIVVAFVFTPAVSVIVGDME